jgi:cytidylate kinase
VADLIITIDGPAASGKSTAARGLAQKIGASFLDTGAMYRAVTLAAMQDGIDLKNEQELLGIIKRSVFEFHEEKGQMKVRINGVDVTEQIRSPQVTANARHIALAPKVREELVQMQRQFAVEQHSIVTEGRDQGTVAFVDADIKFFLTADSIERAKRRQVELQTKGQAENLEETDLPQVQKAIEERDKSDRDRTVGPLKPADDAIVIDTTNLNIEQVVEKLLSCVKEKCSGKN